MDEMSTQSTVDVELQSIKNSVIRARSRFTSSGLYDKGEYLTYLEHRIKALMNTTAPNNPNSSGFLDTVRLYWYSSFPIIAADEVSKAEGLCWLYDKDFARWRLNEPKLKHEDTWYTRLGFSNLFAMSVMHPTAGIVNCLRLVSKFPVAVPGLSLIWGQADEFEGSLDEIQARLPFGLTLNYDFSM